MYINILIKILKIKIKNVKNIIYNPSKNNINLLVAFGKNIFLK
jgi:hypothetical protein